MILNNFYIKVYIRVAFIVMSGVVSGIVLQHIDRGYYYTLSGLVAIILFQTYMLINQVNKTNTDLEKFLSSVQDHDSSIRFDEGAKDSTFRKLHSRMNDLNTIIQHIKVENERTRQFLRTIVDHVDIGLLSFDNNGRIDICNKAAKKYITAQQPRKLMSLKTGDNELYEIIGNIRPGQEILHKMRSGGLLQNVLVKATEIKFENNVIKLVSLADITNELDKKELDSWQRLIRVLTHEIMNSLSPITSLTTVISGYFKDSDSESPISPEKINQQIISKTLNGLNTIEETGKGLLDFVDKYRSLTSLPKPKLCKFSVDYLFGKCKLLMESIMPANIKIVGNVYPPDLSLVADHDQVEQILINLLKNAADAFPGGGEGIIQMKAFFDVNNVLIQVEDNGTGIPDDIIEDIFIPFFTTKKNGSGIGLSISRQIMQNHNGAISLHSVPGEGSVFTLKFQGRTGL